MQLIIQIAPLLILIVLAFGCGYGDRDYSCESSQWPMHATE